MSNNLIKTKKMAANHCELDDNIKDRGMTRRLQTQ